jgi:hypothetical protein
LRRPDRLTTEEYSEAHCLGMFPLTIKVYNIIIDTIARAIAKIESYISNLVLQFLLLQISFIDGFISGKVDSRPITLLLKINLPRVIYRLCLVL